MRTSGTSRAITFAVFVLAFAVRFAWALRVQSPLTAVYSDMGGYVERAQWLLAGTIPAKVGALTFYPWGAHCFIALELAVFGPDAPVAIAVVHALVGAVPAACVVPLTLRLVPVPAAAACAGVLVAFWQPQVVYVGFFLSEIWFSALIALHAVLSVRRAPGGARALAVGRSRRSRSSSGRSFSSRGSSTPAPTSCPATGVAVCAAPSSCSRGWPSRCSSRWRRAPCAFTVCRGAGGSSRKTPT